MTKSRSQKRRDEKARRNRMARNGTVLGPDGQPMNRSDLPPVQVMLAQQAQALGVIAALLESLCRLTLGQTEADIEKVQGIRFPIGPSKEELIEAMKQEMERLESEQSEEDAEAVAQEAVDAARVGTAFPDGGEPVIEDDPEGILAEALSDDDPEQLELELGFVETDETTVEEPSLD